MLNLEEKGGLLNAMRRLCFQAGPEEQEGRNLFILRQNRQLTVEQTIYARTDNLQSANCSPYTSSSAETNKNK